MNTDLDKWVVRIKGRGYASQEYFRNGGSGRPIVKTRDKALVLTSNQCFSGHGTLVNVFLHMRSVGVRKADIEIRAADSREDFLGLAGWWDMFSTFSKVN